MFVTVALVLHVVQIFALTQEGASVFIAGLLYFGLVLGYVRGASFSLIFGQVDN